MTLKYLFNLTNYIQSIYVTGRVYDSGIFWNTWPFKTKYEMTNQKFKHCLAKTFGHLNCIICNYIVCEKKMTFFIPSVS